MKFIPNLWAERADQKHDNNRSRLVSAETFSLKAHYCPAYHIGADCSDWTVPTLWNSLLENVLHWCGQFCHLFCKGSACFDRPVIIEWVQFVLQNWEKPLSVWGVSLLEKHQLIVLFTSDVMYLKYKWLAYTSPDLVLGRFVKQKTQKLEHKNLAWSFILASLLQGMQPLNYKCVNWLMTAIKSLYGSWPIEDECYFMGVHISFRLLTRLKILFHSSTVCKLFFSKIL